MFLTDFSVCASKWAGWLVMTPRTSVAWRSCSTLYGRKLQGELCACFLSHRTGRAVGLDGRVWWEIGNQTLSAVGLFQQAESGLGLWGSQLKDTALVEEFAVGRQGEVTAPQRCLQRECALQGSLAAPQAMRGTKCVLQRWVGSSLHVRGQLLPNRPLALE